MFTASFKRFSSLFLITLLLICIQACAQSKITSSWTDQTFHGPVKGPILVVGAFKNPTAHKIYEDSFVEILGMAGVKAIQSYTYQTEKDRNSKEWLGQVSRESGANAILITHLSNESTKTVDYAAHGIILGGMTFEDAGGYYSYMVEDTLIPEEEVTTTTDFLVATLFDNRTGKPIWSAHSKNVNLNNYLRRDDEKLETLFLKDMKKKHIL